MQFQKHFKSASPISLLLAQIVTSVFGFAVYFLFATPVAMYIAHTGREDAVLRTVVTTIGTFFAVMVGTASTPLLNLRFEKNGYLQKIRNTSKVLFIQTACTALFAWALYGADKDPKSNPFDHGFRPGCDGYDAGFDFCNRYPERPACDGNHQIL